MRRKICSLLLSISIMTLFCTWASAAIIVEDEAVKWEPAYDAPGEVLPDIPPRITTEYVTTMFHKVLVFPQELIDATQYVPSRIIVEYTTTIVHFKPATSPVCARAVWILASCFGRMDCNPGDPCLADFNSDGDVDGSDTAELIALYGLGDCPDFGWPE